jgi:transcriptional regulator with XRE-family HTH domain
MTKTLVEEYVEDPNNMRLFQQERAICEVTELLERTLKEMNLNRADLAKRLGRTRGWVTQLLDGEANKTIRTIADAFAVLGKEFRCSCQPIRISAPPAPCILKLQPYRRDSMASAATYQLDLAAAQ